MSFDLQSGFPLSFSPKRTQERLVYAFDFKNMLAAGEIISSGAWSIQAVRPPTVSSSGMIVGNPNVMSGTIITQQIQGGVNNSVYVVIAKVYTTSNNIIEENALLEVTDSPYK